MSISAGSVHVDLGARLDRREFEAYERELKKVQERTAKRDRFKAELGGNFDNRAFNAYERELKKADHANDQMVRSNARLRTSFGNVWSRGGAAFAAVGGAYAVTTALKSVTKAYGESQVSQEKMRAQLKALGIDYDAHAKQIDAVIQKTSQLSGLDDEDLQDAFTSVVRTTKSVNVGLKEMALVADLARAKHIDVARAGELVAKIHAGNVGPLRRLGLEFIKSTAAVDHLKETTKHYTPLQLEAAKITDKQANSENALGLLRHRLKGQAEAYGKTQAGSMDRVKVAFENLQETIGRKLGPTITRAANGLATFINQMGDGTGKGGQFVDALQTVGRGFTLFARAVRTTASVVAGFFSGILRGFQAVGEAGQHLPGVGDQFRKFAHDADTAADRIDGFRRKMNISVEAGKVSDDLERIRRKTGSSMKSIRASTAEGMDEIRRRLGTDSKRGADALAEHYGNMVSAIRTAMRRGRVSTSTGLSEIRKLMLDELKTLGISSALKSGKPLTNDPAAANRAQRYMGGWLGGRGLVGHDTIPAMLAPGEAVLNRHQQGVIESLLGDGFLDRLFAQVQTPHFMDKGGRIPFAAGGLAPAVSRLANSLVQKFGLSITSTTGGTHAPGSYHYQGLAADLGGPASSMLQASEWLKSSGTYRSLLEGIHNPNLAVKDGQIFPGAGPFGSVWGAHANHVHIALRALGAIAGGGGGGAAWKNIKAPQTAITGLLGAIVQGTLNKTTAGANQRGRSLAASMGGGDITGQGLSSAGGQYNKSSLAALWRQAGGPGNVANLMAAIALAESGGNPSAHNPSGASGLWQILGVPFPGNPMDPGTNARMAVAKYQSQGLGAWEAYTNGSYRRYLNRGGFARYAKGKPGKPSKLARTVGGATAGIMRKIRPMQTDRSSLFDAHMGRVDQLDNLYSQTERRYNISEEELVNSDTGAVNVGAVKRKANELTHLLFLRGQIENELEEAKAIALRIIKSYRRIISALRKSLSHAKRKNRDGIKNYIKTYEGRVGEWTGKVKEIGGKNTGGSLFDAHTDVLELRGELKDVLGTTATPQTPDTPDTSTSDAGGAADTGGADTGGVGTDTVAPPSPLQIAEAAAAEMRTFLTGRQDLLSSFGRNYIPQSQASGTFGAPDPLTASAGLRAFGGAGTAGGLGGATIIANFASAPDNAPTFVQQIRFIAEGG